MSGRDDTSRYTERTHRTSRTHHTNATNASKASTASKASNASKTSEQRSIDFQKHLKGKDEKRGDRNGHTPSDAGTSHLKKSSSTTRPPKPPSKAAPSTISPKSSISSRPTPSEASSSATVKPSRKHVAPSIPPNIPTHRDDRTVIADENNGGRRSASASEAGRSAHSSSIHKSRSTSQAGTNYSQQSKNLSSTYNPAASRRPASSEAALSNMSESSRAGYLPDAEDLARIKREHKNVQSIAMGYKDLAEQRAGRSLGNTVAVDEHGDPIGVGTMSFHREFGAAGPGGVHRVRELKEGDPKLGVRAPRPAASSVVSSGSRSSHASSRSGMTLLPYGRDFDRVSEVSRGASGYERVEVEERRPDPNHRFDENRPLPTPSEFHRSYGK